MICRVVWLLISWQFLTNMMTTIFCRLCKAILWWLIKRVLLKSMAYILQVWNLSTIIIVEIAEVAILSSNSVWMEWIFVIWEILARLAALIYAHKLARLIFYWYQLVELILLMQKLQKSLWNFWCLILLSLCITEQKIVKWILISLTAF